MIPYLILMFLFFFAVSLMLDSDSMFGVLFGVALMGCVVWSFVDSMPPAEQVAACMEEAKVE